MSRNLRVAICQLPSDLADDATDPRPANLARAETAIRSAAADGAQLILFGEIYLNGYRSDWHLPRVSTFVNPPDADITRLTSLCAELNTHVVMGISRRSSDGLGKLFNSAVVIGPEGPLGQYDKVHLGTFGMEDGRIVAEGAFWDGGAAFPVFDLPQCRIGVQICRDVRYPEASRAAAVAGAELLVNVSAALEERSESWDLLARARAAENQGWFVMVSVVGHQKDTRLMGASRIIDPEGRLVLRVPDYAEEIALFDLDLERVQRLRAASHLLARRVPDAYGNGSV